jgi:hypothetical protein
VEFTGTTPSELPTKAYFYLRVEDVNSYKVYPTYADANAQTNVITFANAVSGYNSRLAGLTSIAFSSLSLVVGEMYRITGKIAFALTNGSSFHWALQTNRTNTPNIYHTALRTVSDAFWFILESATSSQKYIKGNCDIFINVTEEGIEISGSLGTIRTTTPDYSGAYGARTTNAVSGFAELVFPITTLRLGDIGSPHPLNIRNGSNLNLYKLV